MAMAQSYPAKLGTFGKLGPHGVFVTSSQWGLAQKFTSSGWKCLTWLVDRMHVCRSLCLWRMLGLEAAKRLLREALVVALQNGEAVADAIKSSLKLQRWQHQIICVCTSQTIHGHPECTCSQSFGRVWTGISPEKVGRFLGVERQVRLYNGKHLIATVETLGTKVKRKGRLCQSLRLRGGYPFEGIDVG